VKFHGYKKWMQLALQINVIIQVSQVSDRVTAFVLLFVLKLYAQESTSISSGEKNEDRHKREKREREKRGKERKKETCFSAIRPMCV